MSKQGVVNIHGKEYLTVAHRVNQFREQFKPDDGWSIRTWLIYNEGDRVIIQATICDKDDHVVATGFAEEVRGSSKINKTSALENCETSAIGRALAAFGLGGEEYCSADELVSALKQQAQQESRPSGADRKTPTNPSETDRPKATKFDPRKRCEKWLDKLVELVGEEDARERFTRLMKHSDHSGGALSLDGVKDFGKMRDLSEEIKEMVESTEKNMKEEE